MKDFCEDCIYYPCSDCDSDTETIECDYKEVKESEQVVIDRSIPKCLFCSSPRGEDLYPDRESGVGPGFSDGFTFLCGTYVSYSIPPEKDKITQSWTCKEIVKLKKLKEEKSD